MNFVIIATGYNCESFVRSCVRSITNLTISSFKAVFISDGSTDGTPEAIVNSLPNDSRYIAECWPTNEGAAFRRYHAIRKHAINPDDIIILLGLDDELYMDALSRIGDQHREGKWMTYGNWRDQMGNKLPHDFDLEFPYEIHRTRDYRKVYYRSTAPNTFRRFLFDMIPEDDFKFEGRWFRCTTESHLMFCCLEMCGKERIGVIHQPIYKYNKRGRHSTKNTVGRLEQNRVYQGVISRPKYPLYEDLKRSMERKDAEPAQP